MKKTIFALLFISILTACSKAPEQNNQQSATINTPVDTETVFSFDINTIEEGCTSDSQMICAINVSIKCTINPEFSECTENKAFMPNFIFMQDESLKRPTSQTYKITKLKPLSDGTVEVHTQSTCNGNWFGLCNGNIIYVMDYQNNHWMVKDLYAIED